MVISKEYFPDFRLSLPEVIWLEPEHYQQASKVSSKFENEAQQWQAYINILARSALLQWLQEKIADKPIDIKPNITESVSGIKLGDFRLSVVAQEHVLDEVVSIPQVAIERPELAAHFYVVLEVDEEQEEAILRGILRHDELIEYRSQVNLQPSNSGHYKLPLSLFDAEPNRLLFYSRHLEPTAIPLTSIAAENVQDSLKKTFSSSRTAINVKDWLSNELDELARELSWILLPIPTAASGLRDLETVNTSPIKEFAAIVTKLKAREDIPETARGACKDFDLASYGLRLFAITWDVAEIEDVPEWSLLLVLGAQLDNYLPQGLKLEVKVGEAVLYEKIVAEDTDDSYIHTDVIIGELDEQFTVNIILADGTPSTPFNFVFN